MQERSAEILYFADVPPLQELCLVVVTVPANCKLGSGKQPHIIRCRELIFTEPDILATPSLGRGQCVQIIMKCVPNTVLKCGLFCSSNIDSVSERNTISQCSLLSVHAIQLLYKTGRLQNRFQKMGLQVEKPRRVTPAIFQSCFRYTLLAKLAPGWNKMGDYLVQGRDFVITSEKMNAICLDVTVTEKEVCLAVQAHIIKSSHIQLADLGVCRPVWNAFIREGHGKIEEYSICNKWCHILPSMKMGKIVNLLRQIPEDSPFKTYKDIKRYWKNTYGYRLPETDEDIIYYQVYFKPIGNILFTYPECCVRAREALVFARTDPRPILQSFFAEFHAKLPNVCGQKLCFSTNAKYHIAGLLSVYKAEDSIEDNVVNLTGQVPTHQQHMYRQRITQSQPPMRRVPGLSQLNQLTSGSTVSNECVKKVVPVFRVKPHQQHNGVIAFRPHNQVKPKWVPVLHPAKPTSSTAHSQSGTPTLHSSMDCIPPTQSTASSIALTKKPVFLKNPSMLFHSAFGHTPATQNGTTFAKKPVSMMERNSSLSFSRNSLAITDQASSAPVSVPQLAESSGKRKHDFQESDVKAKKPRVKSKVQEDVDVETLAKANQLAKVNMVTLLAWLRNKGIACKNKDKKGDLVEKVMHMLKLTVAEQ